jgi:hypothetical protein
VIKAGAAVAMRKSLRRASSSNRPDCVEDLLRVGGFSPGVVPGKPRGLIADGKRPHTTPVIVEAKDGNQ